MSRPRMSLADWHACIESAPLTDNQLGRIMAEWARLGLAADDDRAERLSITAALAGVDNLGSTLELTQGQAGRVVRALSETRHRDDLPAIEPAEPEPQPTPRLTATWADLTGALAQAMGLIRAPGLAVGKGDELRPSL